MSPCIPGLLTNTTSATMGRYEQDNSRPYPEFGNSGVGRFLLVILGWFHRTFVAPIDELFPRTSGKKQKRSRTRRWLICWTMGLLVLIIAAAFTAGNIATNQRDFELTNSQPIEQGTLLAEDFSACVMDIDLQGQHVTANTACNRQNVFPAGTRISLVQDPEDPTRFLAVEPGQDWEPDPVGSIIIGSMIGLMIAGFTVAIGYHLLLRNEVSVPRPSTTSAPQEPERAQEKHVFSNSVENIDATLDRKKFQFANLWTNFVEKNLPVRATLLALVLIALSVLAIGFGAANTAEISRDRQLVRSEPIRNSTLLEIGGRAYNASVELDTKVYQLQYPLRWELFKPTGQSIPVVHDPADTTRLIPVEIDELRGPIVMVKDNLPTILIWIALVCFFVWMFIPREIAALAERFDNLMGIKKRTPRH